MTVKRADPAEMRKAVTMSQHFIKNGIYFIPVPVVDEDSANLLLGMLISNLEKLEKLAGEKDG